MFVKEGGLLMIRIFTTPRIMQKYVANPIIESYTQMLKQSDDNPIVAEIGDELLIESSPSVVAKLKNLMKNYSGFKFYANNGKFIWIHEMKPTSLYEDNKLVVSLEPVGEFLKFSTDIVLGKINANLKTSMTVFGGITIIGILMLIGLAGSYEIGRIDTVQFLLSAVITSLVAWVSFRIEKFINPFFYNEIITEIEK